MREFLLKMYSYMKRFSSGERIHAAVSVALSMLDKEDRLVVHGALISGRPPAEMLPKDMLRRQADPAVALGAALALRSQVAGSVVAVPLCVEQISSESVQMLLSLTVTMCLPIVFLMQCEPDFSEDLQAQEALGDIERIHADGQDVMRLMPAIRLAIDKAREGDGATLIECVWDNNDRRSPADKLAKILITEGYATPEELL